MLIEAMLLNIRTAVKVSFVNVGLTELPSGRSSLPYFPNKDVTTSCARGPILPGLLPSP